MPPRRGRGRTTRRTEEESRAGSDDDFQQVENVTRQIGEMELVLERFQRMNPPTFSAVVGGAMAEAWLVQMEELFDTLEYAPEKRVKLAVLQLRDVVQRWWRDRQSGPRSETIFLQSACTRKLMDFGTIGFSSSRRSEQVQPCEDRATAAAAVGDVEGEEGAAVSHSLKSSSYAQHIELSIRAGIMNPVLV
ncbi:hypothetical protein F511_35528 [Dorcoceras hygrometricum]|uniref:Uncharacterized protein n=1 Tax=Dorcoceras hygrometricum TaxID=472368 RepID=A0A2Z7CUR1_9LAMI|nr:hypothetical protein F511_35528 [Dorcoceras hygrometricum]